MLQQAISTKTLANIYPALALDTSVAAARRLPRLIAEERYVDNEAQLQRAQRESPILNSEQRTVFDAITAATAAGEVTHSTAPCLHGPPGVCNSHLF